jgi:DNA-binding beta-propeller fold protein YncE
MGSKSWVRSGGIAWALWLGVWGFAIGCSAPTSEDHDFGGGDDFEGGVGGKAGGGPIADFRPVVTAERTPPPISGGTLIALRQVGRAVVADPDRDVIQIVDTRSFVRIGSIALEVGAEPGRLVEDAEGRVHVVLRGKGEVVTIDPTTIMITERRPVCRAPRGIAYIAEGDALAVACLEGTLVELPAAGGEAIRTTDVAPDLRDVVVLGSQLVVTRFRSAEILYLDAERSVTKRVTPLDTNEDFAATTAWRAVATPRGELLISHQRSLDGSIDISGGGGTGGTDGSGIAGTGTGAARGTESGYGSSFDPCASIVQGTLSTATSDGVVSTHRTMPGIALPVDVAVSPSGNEVAVANGAFDVGAMVFGSAMSFVVLDNTALTGLPIDCSSTMLNSAMAGTAISVAYDAQGYLLVQMRQPSQLWVYDQNGYSYVVPLGGVDVTDTGNDIFHADTGSNIACASCHAEGGEDGHVWNFVGLGARRTQPLDIGLEGSAPFHWDGELPSFGDLVHEVLELRMGGPIESVERTAALERYVYGLKRRPSVRAVQDEAVGRGKALFESEEIGCSGCHSGPKFTTGETEDIGKGVPMQVPSLVSVSVRAPYMHDGCAATLMDRFDPACGGTDHGHPELLDDAGRADLIAYLETL